MRRFAVPAVISLVAIALLVALAVGISHQGPNNSIAYSVASGHYREAPEYRHQMPVIQDSTASTRSLADYRGHVLLVNMYASWCTQCAQEAGVLAQAQKLFRAHGGTVVGIAWDTPASQANAFDAAHHVNYPVLQDSAGTFADAVNEGGVPDTYVMDAQGRIVALNLYTLSAGWVRQALSKALAQST